MRLNRKNTPTLLVAIVIACSLCFVAPSNALAFSDVSSSTPHSEDIVWLGDTGIAQGYQDGTYGCMRPVYRQDMAAFLRRLAIKMGDTEAELWQPDESSWSSFNDVNADTPHAEDILWLAKMGISAGYKNSDGSCSFKPMTPVYRQDMAAFMRRLAMHLGDTATSQYSDYNQNPGSFSDVSFNSDHCWDTWWLYDFGVATGYSDGTFRGMTYVYRQDMAAFIHRFFGKVQIGTINNDICIGGWSELNGLRVYLKPSGEALKGEWCLGGKWYHFDEQTGAMSVGFTTLSDGRIVYYGSDGAMVYGERNIDNKWYHFNESNGAMSTGLTKLPDGRTVLYSSDGVMLYGKQEFDGRIGYFDTTSGKLLTSCWVEDDGVSYFVDSEGYIKLCRKKDDSGRWVITDLNGNVQGGWIKDSGATFYADPSTGRICTGQQRIDGYWYYFDDSTGAMIYGWKYISNQSKWVWYGPNGGDGRMRYGYQTVDGVQRYFDTLTGACDKIGYQNPSQYFQVSSRTVTLPGYAQNHGKFSYVTPSRISVDASKEDCINAMIGRAYEYVGTTPYIWDYACAPGVGVDCAGLVMQCLYATGMDLSPSFTPYDHYYTPGHNHYANDMWSSSKFWHLSYSQRERGDLVCWPGHIAIYIGNDQVIEAVTPQIGVRITKVYNVGKIKGVLRPFV